MAWFSRLLNRAIALRTIEATRASSARNTTRFCYVAGMEWEPESRVAFDLSSTDEEMRLGKHERNQRGRILGTHSRKRIVCLISAKGLSPWVLR